MADELRLQWAEYDGKRHADSDGLALTVEPVDGYYQYSAICALTEVNANPTTLWRDRADSEHEAMVAAEKFYFRLVRRVCDLADIEQILQMTKVSEMRATLARLFR